MVWRVEEESVAQKKAIANRNRRHDEDGDRERDRNRDRERKGIEKCVYAKQHNNIGRKERNEKRNVWKGKW